jgi:hypothetical protein
VGSGGQRVPLFAPAEFECGGGAEAEDRHGYNAPRAAMASASRTPVSAG